MSKSNKEFLEHIFDECDFFTTVRSSVVETWR